MAVIDLMSVAAFNNDSSARLMENPFILVELNEGWFTHHFLGDHFIPLDFSFTVNF